MKRHLLIVLIALAYCSRAAAASLTPAEIHAAVEEAAEQYLGDFPSGVVIRSVVAERLRDIPVSHASAVTYPPLHVFLTLAVPPLPPSEMLLVRPGPIESFGRP